MYIDYAPLGRRCVITKKKQDQHIWKEILVSPELFAPVQEYEDLTADEAQILKEAKQLLSQLLFDRVVELANEHFTDHQKKVLALTQMPDKTYNDIAEILNINYTGVSHAIKGIKSQKHGKYHGGFEKKLRKVCTKDTACQEYLTCIKELRNNNPQKALEYLQQYDTEPEYWANYVIQTEEY